MKAKQIAFAVAVVGLLVGNVSAQEKTLAQKYLDGEAKIKTPFTYTGAPVTIRYSTFLGKAGATPALYEKLWDRLKQDSGGKVIIQPFWSNSLTDAQTGAFEAVSSGLTDMSTCYTQINPGGFDLHFGVQLPQLFTESSVGSLVFNEIYAKYLKTTYERRGVLLARVGLTPPQQLLSKEPLKTFDDFKGKRAWSTGKVANLAVASLGLVPTSLKISELYTGFQSGVIAVAPMHDAGAPLFRLTDIAKSRTVVNLWTNPNEHCINRAFWGKLPNDLQAYLYHWFQVWTQIESQLYYDAEALRARAFMQSLGIQFIELSAADQAKVSAGYKKVVDDWINEQEAAKRPGKAMYNDMRALKSKYEAISREDRMRMVLDMPVKGLITGF
ncbi:MAG: TRAP transporter substrate-binding protein DctP [Burkholderiales bacterium]